MNDGANQLPYYSNARGPTILMQGALLFGMGSSFPLHHL